MGSIMSVSPLSNLWVSMCCAFMNLPGCCGGSIAETASSDKESLWQGRRRARQGAVNQARFDGAMAAGQFAAAIQEIDAGSNSTALNMVRFSRNPIER